MSYKHQDSSDERSMRERMLAGDWYIADDPQLATELRRAAKLTEAFNTCDPLDSERRLTILRELLGFLGDGAMIRPPIRCDYGYQIHIGARTFINFGAIFLDVAKVTIGEDVQVGPNVQFLTATHPVEPTARRAKFESAKPITIGDNVWLGGGVIILPGINIGENAVVGAGAVVTKDIPANVVAVGNPARVIRQL
jgi:maltose O-acetyltransferase